MKSNGKNPSSRCQNRIVCSLTQELKEENFSHLRQKEWEYFEEEYKVYKNHSPSPEDKGAPIILFDAKNDVGLVFSHGYMAALKLHDLRVSYIFPTLHFFNEMIV